jgi:hypothetical protein
MENNEEQRRTLIFALFLNQHYGELVCELFPDYYDKNLKFSDLHIGKTMGGHLALLCCGVSLILWNELETLPYYWKGGMFGVQRYFDIYRMISLEDKV